MGRSMRTAGAQTRGRVWLCTLVTAVWGGVARGAAAGRCPPPPGADRDERHHRVRPGQRDPSTAPPPTRRDYAATLSANQTVSIDNPYGDVHALRRLRAPGGGARGVPAAAGGRAAGAGAGGRRRRRLTASPRARPRAHAA